MPCEVNRDYTFAKIAFETFSKFVIDLPDWEKTNQHYKDIWWEVARVILAEDAKNASKITIST